MRRWGFRVLGVTVAGLVLQGFPGLERLTSYLTGYAVYAAAKFPLQWLHLPSLALVQLLAAGISAAAVVAVSLAAAAIAAPS